MLVNKVSSFNSIYGLYQYQKPAVNKNNVINFRGSYKLGEDFEFANQDNIDNVTKLFCEYRKNAGQTNVSAEKTKNYIEKQISNPEHKILALKDEGEYAGFVLFSKTHSTIDLHPFLVIDAMYVSPDHRGKKLSNKMVGELKEYAKFNNYKGIHVKTWANNVISNKLYQGTGFNDETKKYTTYFWANNKIFDYQKKYMNDEN